MNIAQNLKKVMEEKQVTKYRLAKMLDVHQTTVKNWLDGKTEPKFDMVEKIAEALGVQVSELFDFSRPSELAEQVINEIQDSMQEGVQDLIEAGKNAINDFYASDPKYIVHYWEQLNEPGRIEATRRVLEMTKLPEYTTPDEE